MGTVAELSDSASYLLDRVESCVDDPVGLHALDDSIRFPPADRTDAELTLVRERIWQHRLGCHPKPVELATLE